MAGDPGEWPEVIEPGAFGGTGQDVPLRMGSAGPVIGSARVKSTPAGLEATMKTALHSEMNAAQDDCLIAIEDGKPLPVARLQVLPPWRAVLLARVADRAGTGLERGTLAQLVAEARAVTGSGELGAWWERP